MMKHSFYLKQSFSSYEFPGTIHLLRNKDTNSNEYTLLDNKKSCKQNIYLRSYYTYEEKIANIKLLP